MMKKIIIASCIIILASCTTNSEPEIVYDEAIIADEMPIVTPHEKRIVQDTPMTTKTDKDNNPVITYPKYDIFQTLQRNDRQINKIYAETTKKIYLTPDGEEIRNKTQIIEEDPEETEEPEEDVEQEDYTSDCVTYCGEGYSYSHNGELLNGYERICIKYPLPCGEECRKDWYIQSLIYDTNYTCQEAIQKESNEQEEQTNENAEAKTN